jgi:ABC-2 type transport system permease protein
MSVRLTPLLAAEAKRMWREPRLRLVALLACVLLLVVFLTSWQDTSRLANERVRFAAAERERWVSQGQKDPHSAAHFGVWAVKPASPLAVLAPGIEPFVGLAVWLEAHKRNEMLFRPGQDAPPIMRNATSVAQLLEVLGPLFAILLGYAGFAQDRERGTLRLALGNGVAPRRMLLARCLVMSGVLAIAVLLPAAACGVFALATLPDTGWDGAGRLLLWCAMQFVYLESFLLAALAVSLRAPGARAALTILLTLWLAFCVLLPRVAGNAVQALTPAPSYQDIRQRTEKEAPAYEGADKWEARKSALLAKANGKPVDLRAAQLDQSERESHEVFDRLLGSFYDAIEHQDRAFGWAGVLSPAVALQSAGTAVAGTDFYQHRHFIDAAEHYRRMMVNGLNGALMAHAGHDGAVSTGKQFWESVPAFSYPPPTLGMAISNAAPALALLMAWCALAAAAAWRAVQGVQP